MPIKVTVPGAEHVVLMCASREHHAVTFPTYDGIEAKSRVWICSSCNTKIRHITFSTWFVTSVAIAS